jgi:hypothetical protein
MPEKDNSSSLYLVNLESEDIQSAFLLDGVPNESVYGICIIPPTFGDPPPALLC